ncbi:hypothetical protein ACFY8K_25605 [Streptomyces misionensis]
MSRTPADQGLDAPGGAVRRGEPAPARHVRPALVVNRSGGAATARR